MLEPRQKIMLTLGKAGCYFLSMVHIAESCLSNRRIDAIEKFLDCVQKGYCREDCFVENPAGVMNVLYGGRWEYHKEGPDYQPVNGEFEILRFERATPEMVYSHFVYRDRAGCIYDPLGDSKTVAGGRLISKRILKLVIGEG